MGYPMLRHAGEKSNRRVGFDARQLAIRAPAFDRVDGQVGDDVALTVWNQVVLEPAAARYAIGVRSPSNGAIVARHETLLHFRREVRVVKYETPESRTVTWQATP